MIVTLPGIDLWCSVNDDNLCYVDGYVDYDVNYHVDYYVDYYIDWIGVDNQ